jgi:hypothetical protein
MDASPSYGFPVAPVMDMDSTYEAAIKNIYDAKVAGYCLPVPFSNSKSRYNCDFIAA